MKSAFEFDELWLDDWPCEATSVIVICGNCLQSSIEETLYRLTRQLDQGCNRLSGRQRPPLGAAKISTPFLKDKSSGWNVSSRNTGLSGIT